MSDHLPIIATRTFKRAAQTKDEQFISYRDIKNMNKDDFLASLNKAPWDCSFVFEDPNDVLDSSYDMFNAIVNEHLKHLKQKRVKRQVQPKWFNKTITAAINARDNRFVKATKTRAEEDWAVYRRQKNRVTSLIRKTKQSYFKDKFTENKHNSRRPWSLIKCLSKEDDGTAQGVQRLVEGDVEINDNTIIAETMISL